MITSPQPYPTTKGERKAWKNKSNAFMKMFPKLFMTLDLIFVPVSMFVIYKIYGFQNILGLFLNSQLMLVIPTLLLAAVVTVVVIFI